MSGRDNKAIAERFDLPVDVVEAITGETDDDLAANVEAVVRALGLDKPEPARAKAEAAEPNPNADVLAALFENKAERQRDFMAKVFGESSPEPEADPDAPPDFDGGAREPVPPPRDPLAEHNELVADLAAAKSAEPRRREVW